MTVLSEEQRQAIWAIMAQDDLLIAAAELGIMLSGPWNTGA